jgi:hypothetical protein
MLFDFSLRSLNEIDPWGEPPNLSLSWFGFTDGFYRLKVGSNYLFDYSGDYIKHCEEKLTIFKQGSSYVDYQVVRLWEDILDILPNVLEPIPEDLCVFLEMSQADWNSWWDKVADWEEAQIKLGRDEDSTFSVVDMAIELRRSRYLHSAHLRNSPNIWIWSTDLRVNISWDNQDIVEEEIPVWSAIRGNHCMGRADFLSEVKAFHEKLIFEMGQRVNAICNHWEYPEIHVDTQQLKYEQEDRATWLDTSLRKAPTFNNWDDIRSATRLIAESRV